LAYNTNRKEDTRLEHLVNDYLDQHLFNKGYFSDVEWVKDKKGQLEGADIILNCPSLGIENARVDIKSAVKYSNKYLGTYALECGFIGRQGDEKIGWLIDEDKKTDYYLLLYPKSQKYYTDMQTVDDIESIEYYLVARDKVLNYLKRKGFSKDIIKETVGSMRDEYNGFTKGLVRESGDDGFFFYLTGNLAEQPVNVVIKRSVYDKISVLHETVR
jgi:hypothetical protein